MKGWITTRRFLRNSWSNPEVSASSWLNNFMRWATEVLNLSSGTSSLIAFNVFVYAPSAERDGVPGVFACSRIKSYTRWINRLTPMIARGSHGAELSYGAMKARYMRTVSDPYVATSSSGSMVFPFDL